jgi:hypothetical protein
MGGLKWRAAVCKCFLVFSLISAGMCRPVFGQTAGTILGTVRDTSGGVLAGATITAHNTETGIDRSSQTGEDGGYRFSALAVGHYDISAERSGFKTSTQKGITLDVAQEVVTNFSLEVGAASQTVEVTAEAPVINTTSGQLGGLVSEEKISELPLNGRNYDDLTLLQPGVAQTSSVVNLGGGTQGVIYSSNGATIRSNNYLLDGAPMQNIFGFNAASASGSTLGLDGIREYRVITSAFPAEYGMTMGSQMVIVSKGGSNQFHGDVYEYLRNRVLDARNFFDTSQANCEIQNPSASCKRSPTYERNNFGGAFGGPIRKDKTFLWGVYEGLRQVKGNPVITRGISAQCVAEGLSAASGSVTIPGNGPKTYTVPGNHQIDGLCDPALTAAGAPDITVSPTIQPYLALYDPADSIYTQISPTSVNYGQMRVDQNFGNKDSMFVRYTIDQASEVVPGPGFGATPYGYKEFDDSWTSRNQYVTVSENHIFSPALLNSVRLSFSRTNVPTNYINNKSATGVSTSSCTVVSSAQPCTPGTDGTFLGGGNPMGLVVIGAAATGGGSALTTMGPDFASPNYHLQNFWSLGDDIFYTKGKHAFKFGFLGNRVQIIDGEPVFGRGVIDFIGCAPYFVAPPFANDGVGNALDCFLANRPTLTMEASPPLGRRDYRYETYGFYGQDDWRLTSRLTLNLGLRYEFNSTMNETNGQQTALLSPLSSTLTPGKLMANPSLHNFGPRTGFAYDPFGKGKTSIRGAFGIYYDISTIGDTTFGETVGDPPYRQTNGFNAAPQGFQMSPGWITSTNYKGIFTPLNPCAGVSNATPCPGAYPAPGATNTFTGYEPYASFGSLQYGVKQPYMLQWNLSIDQQLPGGIGLTISYVGTRGNHLWTQADENPCQPTNVVGTEFGVPNTSINWVSNPIGTECPAGGGNQALAVGTAGGPVYNNNSALGANQPCPAYSFNNLGAVVVTPYGFSNGPAGPSNDGRFNCSFGSEIQIETSSKSWYDALQLTLNKRLGHGLEFQSSYTWSKELDTTSGQIFIDGEIRTPGTPLNFDKGPGVINSPQNWRFNMIYHFGSLKSENFAAKLLNGWRTESIVSVQSGYSLTPSDTQENEENTLSHNNGGYERPSIVTSTNLAYALTINPNAVVYNPNTVYTHQATQWFNPNMFTLPTPGNLPNVSRGLITGPGLVDWDFSMVKVTTLKRLGESGNLEFRADFFNILNHANLVPNTAAGNGIYNNCGTIGNYTTSGGTVCSGAAAFFLARDGRDIQFALKLNF